MLSNHAQNQTQIRGIRSGFVDEILSHADIERPIGDNCRVIRVSKRRARKLNLNDRLGRYAIIWSDDSAQVVTILPIHNGRTGAQYRRSN